MATTVNLRKTLDLKRWENCAPAPFTSVNMASCCSTLADGYQFWASGFAGNGAFALYNPAEDGWIGLPNLTLAGNTTVMCYHPSGPTGTASAATATTLTTTVTAVNSLAGYTVRITGGTGAGQERTIASSTNGANAVLTVSSAWTTTPDATSTYLLLTGRVWLFNASGTPALHYYDVATNTVSGALSVTGFTGSTAACALTATPAFGNTIASGTATAGTTTTLTNSAKGWASNQFANYQVRITGGTGAGQVRTVASNTGTVLTVSSAFGTAPDATSTYVIEPNDDYLYAAPAGNGTALYRYSISGNAWTTLAAGSARAQYSASLMWVGIASDGSWANESSVQNGRYLYAVLNSGSFGRYDITANTWTTLAHRAQSSNLTASGYTWWSVFNSMSGGFYADREFLYAAGGQAGGYYSVWRYNVVTGVIDQVATVPYVSGVQLNGYTCQHLAMASYADGGTTLRWLYTYVPSNLSPAGIYGSANYAMPFLRMLII